MNDGIQLLEYLGCTVNDFTALDRDFLTTLHRLEGEATTSALRQHSGLERQQIHYRFDKLEDSGLINVSRVGDNHDGRKTNVARLTWAGEIVLESGAFDDLSDPSKNLEALRREIDGIKGRFENVENELRERRNTRDERLDELEERVSRLEAFNATDNIDAFTHAQEREIHGIIRTRFGVEPEAVGVAVTSVLPALTSTTVNRRFEGSGSIKWQNVAHRFEEYSDDTEQSLLERIERLEEYAVQSSTSIGD